MRLNNLKPNPGAKHRRRRVGNGESSGLGKTCGRGHKGQKSRSGKTIRVGFEGGQMPLYRRLPRRGFSNVQFRDKWVIVNVSTLEERFEAGATVNEDSLRAANLIKGSFDSIKVLGEGEISKGLTVEVTNVSASAREKIEKAGGSITIVKKERVPAEAKPKKAKAVKAAPVAQAAPAPEPQPEPEAAPEPEPEADGAEPEAEA